MSLALIKTVGKLAIATPTDRDILITRSFAAPRARVFDCHRKPELVRRWLLGPPGWSMPVCDIDFRVGGRYRYVWRNDDGREMAMAGIYQDIVTPERIVTTELFDQDWTGGEAVSTLVLTEQDDMTLMALTVRYASKQARDGALATPMAEGMEMGYGRLDALLGSEVPQ